jgi:hypothetical protein
MDSCASATQSGKTGVKLALQQKLFLLSALQAGNAGFQHREGGDSMWGYKDISHCFFSSS